MKTFTLPDLGEGLQEAEVVAWHAGVGDHVVADQPLVSVETDKAVVEIPSPCAGRIAQLHASVGERIKTGAALVDFEEGEHADTGAIVGELERRVQPPTTKEVITAQSSLKASPAVRARARTLHVDLAHVAPTGAGGTISIADVEAAAGRPEIASKGGPLRGVRRAMALRMSDAARRIASATISDDADINDWQPAEDVTIRLIRAIVAGSKAAPDLNAWYDDVALERRLHTRVDLGIAVDTEDGLIVPVMRDVGNRDAASLRRGLDALANDTRARKVPLAELKGQTITLSNFGKFGGRYAVLDIVPPQVAILGAGRARLDIMPIDGRPVVRRLLPLSLTFDHRVVSGGEAARFLQAAIDDLTSPT
jgi:pyruvate dehydrogenase E2 component (dihydrolipoamide acetyltransferase)